MRRFYDCEDCIGMKAHGRYCQAMGADAPGGVLHPTRDEEEADALARDAIARRDREAGRRTTRAIVVSAVILVMVYAGLIWLVAP